MHARHILTLKLQQQSLHLNPCQSYKEHLLIAEASLRKRNILANPLPIFSQIAADGQPNLPYWRSLPIEDFVIRQSVIYGVLVSFKTLSLNIELPGPTFYTSAFNMSQRPRVSLVNISVRMLVITLLIMLTLTLKHVSCYAVPNMCDRSWVRPPCWRCGRDIVRTEDCLSASICYDGRVVNKVKCTDGQVFSMQARTCIWSSDTRWNDCGQTLPRKPLDWRSSTKVPTTVRVHSSRKWTPTPPHKSTHWPTHTPPPTYTPPTTERTTPRTTTARPALPGACGVKAELFIVGGMLSEEGEWPWQLSINQYYATTDTFRHTCGGALINDQWMLTAAHCVSSDENLYNIIVNAYNLYLVSGNEIRVGVSKIERHPDYVDNPLFLNYPNDIALVKFSDRLELDMATPICLPTADMEFSNPDDCWVAGWGDTRGTGARQVLNDLKVQFTNISYCKEVWGEDLILPTHMCVGDGYDGGCLGDSGGPLMCRRNGRYFAAGVTSWGHGSCRIRGFPNVYTRTSDYIDWIIETIESN